MEYSDTDDTPVPSSGDMAIIGEGTPNRTPVSLQVLQNIYHELTGKSEEVSQSYSAPFLFNANDIQQLDLRIKQTCEQYNIKASNYNIKVFYVNDSQETFSSYDKFASFNAGTPSSVESILLTYNFLIILPKLSEPQSYTVSVRLASKVAIRNKLKDEIAFDIPKMIRIMGGRTAVVSVKYIDYAVARNLLNCVDVWSQTLDKFNPPKVLQFIQKRSSYIRLISRYVVSIVVIAIIYFSLPKLLSSNATVYEFAKFSILALTGVFATYKLADHLGSGAEDSIDSWTALSYIRLTAGDRESIKSAERANLLSAGVALVKFILSLAVSVVAKVIVGFLTI